MSFTSFLKIQNNTWFQSLRGYRKIIPRSKTLNITPKVLPSVIPPKGVRYSVENRNPRNLERLRIAYRNEGWPLENEKKDYWHKLEVHELPHEVKVSLRHITGKIILSVSSNEWCLRKHLFKPSDKSAYLNVGRLFARRCLESGFNEIMSPYEPEPGKKLDILITQIKENGVSLSEPPRLVYEELTTKVKPERPWDVIE